MSLSSYTFQDQPLNVAVHTDTEAAWEVDTQGNQRSSTPSSDNIHFESGWVRSVASARTNAELGQRLTQDWQNTTLHSIQHADDLLADPPVSQIPDLQRDPVGSVGYTHDKICTLEVHRSI
jgi:hypothetical protein